MKNLVSSKRIIAIMTCVLISTVSVLAQTVKKHIVERGETVESIAEKYGVTKASIIEINPDAAQFVYVGMELKIPEGGKTVEKTSSNNVRTNAAKPDTETNLYKNADYSNIKTQQYDVSDFSSYGVFYRASFDDAGKGFYGFEGTAFSDNGWGVNLLIGADIGLVDSDFTSFYFYLGPAYGYVINNIILSATFDFVGAYSGQGKEIKTVTTTQNYGSHKGELISYDKEVPMDNKFNWGLSFCPKVGIKLGKILPYVGIDLNWMQATKKVEAGFVVGVGFDI